MTTINVAINSSSKDILEKNFDFTALSASGANVVLVRGLSDNRIFYQDISNLKWVDTNSNGLVENGEIFEKTQSEKDAYKTNMLRLSAKNYLSETHFSLVLHRAIVLTIMDEINILRAAVVPALPARTANQIRTAITNRINGGTADT